MCLKAFCSLFVTIILRFEFICTYNSTNFAEAAEEASNSTRAQYESERAKLKELNENYEEEIQSIRSRLSQERQLDKG